MPPDLTSLGKLGLHPEGVVESRVDDIADKRVEFEKS